VHGSAPCLYPDRDWNVSRFNNLPITAAVTPAIGSLACGLPTT
jgi:hypothetical protein